MPKNRVRFFLKGRAVSAINAISFHNRVGDKLADFEWRACVPLFAISMRVQRSTTIKKQETER